MWTTEVLYACICLHAKWGCRKKKTLAEIKNEETFIYHIVWSSNPFNYVEEQYSHIKGLKKTSSIIKSVVKTTFSRHIKMLRTGERNWSGSLKKNDLNSYLWQETKPCPWIFSDWGQESQIYRNPNYWSSLLLPSVYFHTIYLITTAWKLPMRMWTKLRGPWSFMGWPIILTNILF